MLSFFSLLGSQQTIRFSTVVCFVFSFVLRTLFIIRALYWADKSNSLTNAEELRSFELQVMARELNAHMMMDNETDRPAQTRNRKKFDIVFKRVRTVSLP